MTERLAMGWQDASFAVVAAVGWMFASLLSCPQVGVEPVSRAGVEITAPVPSVEPILVSIEDDDREFQEDNLAPCGLPGVCLTSPPSLTLAQITPQSACLSVLTRAGQPLRC